MPDVASEEARYRERTPRSAARFEEACRFLPGGDSRSTLFFPPFPLYLARGDGARVWDADGNELVDFTSNHTTLVHGNRPPAVLDAVREQLDLGTCFPEPVTAQVEAARVLTERQPSMERVRFTSSGTEATMQAIRAARAHTGHTLVAKAEGAYHGTQDDMMVSTHPTRDQAGPAARPNPVPRAEGLSSAAGDVVVLPWNDVDAAVALVEEHAGRLAAVIVEPVLGSAGMIPAERGYLEALRSVTAARGIVLIFDEVITFRLAVGGAQETYAVRPDLTCLGKMIGGGFPLGVVGGSTEIMSVFDPTPAGRPRVGHPGSMNANPVSLVAAVATLAELTADRIDAMNERGQRLRDGLAKVAADAGVPLTVTGMGSLLALHFTPGPVRTYRDTWDEDRDLAHAVFLGLVNEGVLIDPRGAASISSVNTDDDCDRFLSAFDAVLSRVVA